MNSKEAYELANKAMSEKRFQHTLAVVQLAEDLAIHHGLDLEKARIAAYLHDFLKEIPLSRQLELAEERNLIRCPEDREAPYVLHGPLAADRLERDYGYRDQEVLKAIAHHTLGRPGMGPLEMLIYSADMTEPNRVFHNVDKLRQALYDNLEKGTLLCVEHTLNYLKRHRRRIHPLTEATYADLKRRNKFAER